MTRNLPAIPRAFSVALTLLVVAGASASAASTASATLHFSREAKYTSTSGTSIISGIVKCTSDAGKGQVSGALYQGSLLLEGCSAPCPKTIGLEFTGELGGVAAAEATSQVGIVIKPGSTFKCGTDTVQITGSVAGEVTPLGTSEKLIFATIAGPAQKIKTINLASGTTLKPVLLAKTSSGTAPVTFESTETHTFSGFGPVEVLF
jgi:hypothetical protein